MPSARIARLTMLSATALLTAALALSGCSKDETKSDPPAAGQVTLSGSVMAPQTCPSPAPAPTACPNRPIAGALVELTAGDKVVTQTNTDAAGRFHLLALAGDYKVVAHDAANTTKTTKDITLDGPMDVTLLVGATK